MCVFCGADSQETRIAFTKDVTVDACFVQLASAANVASAFGGLIYEILISRPELASAITMFVVILVSHLVTDTGIVHQGGLQVFCRYLQEVYSDLSSSVGRVAWQFCSSPSAKIDGRVPALTARGCRMSLLIKFSLL